MQNNGKVLAGTTAAKVEKLADGDRHFLSILDKEIYADQFAAQRLQGIMQSYLVGIGVKPGDGISLATGIIERAKAELDEGGEPGEAELEARGDQSLDAVVADRILAEARAKQASAPKQ